MGTIRGLLKIYGFKIGTQAKFCDKVRLTIKPLSSLVRSSINSLLSCIEKNEQSLKELDKMLSDIQKKDEDCKRLMTIPGVGIITANRTPKLIKSLFMQQCPVVQVAKRKARGYGEKHFKIMAYFLAGKLNFKLFNSYLPTHF